jgi:cytochrome P450
MKALIEVILLFLPLSPFVNLCRYSGFLRRLSLFPRAFGAFSFCIVLYIALSTLLAWQFPQYSAYAIVLASPLAFYVFYWRARPTFGSKRGLPPGSLQLAPSRPWADYLHYMKLAHTYGPIYKMNNFIQPMICVTGIPLGTEFLKRHEESTATPPMPFNGFIPNGFMRYMAPAIHKDYRSRMKLIFSDHAFLEEKVDALAGVVGQTLLEMTKRPLPIHPAPHFQKMTFAILAELFLGLTPQDPELARLEKLYQRIDYRKALFSAKWRTEKSLREIEAIFCTKGLARQSYFSKFLGHVPGSCPKQVQDRTLLRNFIYLLQTSWIDVSDLLTWIFKQLSENQRWIERLRALLQSHNEAEGQSALQLAHRIVLETLRLEQSEYLMRRALHDIHFAGFLIPKGWLVRINIRESHRDATIFANPHDFDPDRFVTTPHGSRQFSPFGIQQKSCLGKGPTLWIGQQFVLELARGFAWELVQDGPRELGPFHWRPSAKLRVRISQVARVLPVSTASSAPPLRAACPAFPPRTTRHR